MSKRTVCLFLTIILTASLFYFACSGVSAETLTQTESLESTSSSDDALAETEETTEEIIPADFPALTVNAISNYFPKASAEYNIATKEVTVTYSLKSSKNILTTQWSITYDPQVFTVSKERNTPTSICPAIGDTAVLSFDEEGTIKFSSSNIYLYDFSSELTPFVQIVFDVNEIDPENPVTTKVDLTVDVLRVSEIDKQTLTSDFDKEVLLVDNCDITETDGINAVRVDKSTSLTPSNFVQATTASPQTEIFATDESGNTVFSSNDEPNTTGYISNETAVSSYSPSQAQSASAATSPRKYKKDEKPKKADKGAVDTGSAGYAFICLGALIVSTSVLFVMRKKEILY